MSRPDVPGEAHLLDGFWEEYGAAAPRPSDAPPSAGRRTGWLLGSLGLVSAVACCGWLAASWRGASGPEWRVVAGCALVGIGGAGGVLLLARRPGEPPRPCTPGPPPPLLILHEPPPEAPDPRLRPLEDRLLHLCKQDTKLLQRLLDHERRRHPCLRRADLLRLAIRHLERDNG
jgi:hypothetical protein